MDEKRRRFQILSRPAWLTEPVRVALMFAAMFWTVGIITPYLPVWLQSRGLTVGEIGLLTVVPQLFRLVAAPLVGFEADRRRAHRDMSILLSVAGFIAWFSLSQATGFWTALVCMLLIALAGTFAALIESIAMSGARLRGHNYGRMRLWGSAAFVVANLVGGWFVSRYGNSIVIWLIVTGAAATLLAACLLPATEPAGTTARRPLNWRDARALLQIRHMPLLLLAAGAVQGAHGMLYTYGTLHWQAQGIDPSWVGVLWALGIATEIALFWWSARLVHTLGAIGLFLLGAVASLVRWTIMGSDPPLALLLPLQILHGVTYAASHLGVMHMLGEITPPDRSATAQALYSVVTVIGIVIATSIVSRAYPVFGGMVYLVMAAMALVGLVAAEIIRRQRPRAG